jgi:hypothetical protein
MKIDELVKSPKDLLSVIPAKAGIQSFQGIIKSLGSGFHRSDDFLRDHQNCKVKSQILGGKARYFLNLQFKF